MAIDTELLRAKVREIDEAEKAARDFREELPGRIKVLVEGAFEAVNWPWMVSEVEAGRALDTMVETRKAEFDALVNGKPKRKRAKKTKTEETKPSAPRRALGRKGLPKGEMVSA